MEAHTHVIDNSGGGSRFEFSPVYNVAVHFIDRHLLENRGDKVAIRTTDDGQGTYAELAYRVNRCGKALLTLGMRRGERMVMVVKDCLRDRPGMGVGWIPWVFSRKVNGWFR